MSALKGWISRAIDFHAQGCFSIPRACTGWAVAVAIGTSTAIGLAPASIHAEPAGIRNLATVVTIDVPGATNTFPFAINAEGVVVGRYLSSGKTHGFLRAPDGSMFTIDYPGASFTVAGSINDQGDIVGWYILPSAPSVRHGFLLRDGEFTSFDPPGSIFTNPLGINERGEIVGRYCSTDPCQLIGSGGGSFHGFLLREGTFTKIDVPGAIETDAWKMNDRGQVVGGFQDPDLKEQLFVSFRDGFMSFAPPGGEAISLDKGGINERGDMVGLYCDTTTPCTFLLTGTHGFLVRDGEFLAVDIPGAAATTAVGINAPGDIVGTYSDGTRFHGYLMSR